MLFSITMFLFYNSQDTVRQVDEGENQTVECLKDTVSDSESLAKWNSQADLPADCSQDADLLLRFSELADKYWNGSKSLLKNQRFKSWHYITLIIIIIIIRPLLFSRRSCKIHL